MTDIQPPNPAVERICAKTPQSAHFNIERQLFNLSYFRPGSKG